MKKVQSTMDAINVRIEALKKEVVDLEACRERLLSSVAGPCHFGDQTPYLKPFMRFVTSCSFLFTSPMSIFFPFSFYPVHFLIFSSTYLISLT